MKTMIKEMHDRQKNMNRFCGEGIGEKRILPEKMALWGYRIAVCIALLLCVFGAGEKHAFQTEHLPNIVLLIAGLVLCLGIRLICRKWAVRIGERALRQSVWAIGVLMLALRCFLVYNYYFYSDWDVDTIVRYSTAVAAREPLNDYFYEYFSMYPNNLLLVWIYGTVMRMTQKIGLDGYTAVLYGQCVLYFAVGQMTFSSAMALTKERDKALFSYVAEVLLVGLSPWVSIPYSDSIALFFVSLLVWIWLRAPQTFRGNMFRMPALGFFSYAGYKIKPQVFIFVIAAGLMGIVRLFAERNALRRNAADAGKRLLAFALGFLLAFAAVTAAITEFEPEKLDRNRAFGLPHFLMLGLNAKSGGVWAWEDVEYSMGFDTVSERNRMNIQKAAERVGEMGASGLLRLLGQKTLTNFDDGTFCWGGEGVFFRVLTEEKIPRISHLIRKFYYGREYRTHYYDLFANCEQALWLALLLLSLRGCGEGGKRQHTILALALFGLILFQTIFEARARYFFCYAPVFILMAAYGGKKSKCTVPFSKRIV